MKRDSITISAVIPAEPGAVYRAWMSSKGHSLMTGSSARIRATAGGTFTAWDGYIRGRTRQLQPGARIVQSWRTTDFADDAEDSRLEVIFAPARGGTRLTLKHTGLPPGSATEYRRGWWDFYLRPMKEYFTSGRT